MKKLITRQNNKHTWNLPLRVRLPSLPPLKETDLTSLSGARQLPLQSLPFSGAARWQADDGSYVCSSKCARVFASPAWRQKFVNGCRDPQHTWDSCRFQTTSDGKRERVRERDALQRAGAIFHKRKAPLSGEICGFRTMICGVDSGTRSQNCRTESVYQRLLQIV